MRSNPILKYGGQKLVSQFTWRADSPLNVEVQVSLSTAQKINSYLPLAGLGYVNVVRKMIAGVEPQPQAFNLFAINLTHPASSAKKQYQGSGHECKICEPIMADQVTQLIRGSPPRS
jgi:hypothetical protein